jgi:hypothetical protein
MRKKEEGKSKKQEARSKKEEVISHQSSGRSKKEVTGLMDRRKKEVRQRIF